MESSEGVTGPDRLPSRGGGLTSEDLFPVVYDELRRLAARHMAALKPGQTLQPTALVHEAFMRLGPGGSASGGPTWTHKGHFFAAAARAMRHILVDEARKKGRIKRGGDRRRAHATILDHVVPKEETTIEGADIDLPRLDRALTALAQDEPRKAQVVELRYFAGLTVAQTAEALGVTTRTVDRDWQYARAWLFDRLKGSGECDGASPGETDRG
jgi:RNA polymerase sigma factor (TIGR02999 family)